MTTCSPPASRTRAADEAPGEGHVARGSRCHRGDRERRGDLLTTPDPFDLPSEHIAGAARFGTAERIVRELSDDEMLSIARAQVDVRLDEAVRYRSEGEVDRA